MQFGTDADQAAAFQTVVAGAGIKGSSGNFLWTPEVWKNMCNIHKTHTIALSLPENLCSRRTECLALYRLCCQ